MPKPPYPIFFYQTQDQPYFSYVVRQARKWNPGTPIYILGGSTLKKYKKYAHWVNVVELKDEKRELYEVYQHMNTNGPEFELMSLERWFLLRAVMKRQGLDQGIYLDSDVMVYCDLQEAAEMVQSPGMTRIYHSPHTNFIANWDTLDKLCELILSYYKQPYLLEKLKAIEQKHVGQYGAGGVSDMTFMGLLYQHYPSKSKDLSDWSHGQKRFDSTVFQGEDFIKEDGLRKIYLKDGVPFSEKTTGERIQFLTLHFQGKSKSLIPQMMDGNVVLNKFTYALKDYQLKVQRRFMAKRGR